MNRAARREAERLTRRMQRKASADPSAVELIGGPMDHWVVKPGAPALEPDWRAKYLEEHARMLHRLQIQEDFHRQIPLTWEALSDVQRQVYRDAARRTKGDGRYVRREGSRYADWVAAAK